MATATATPTAYAYPNGIENGQRTIQVFGTIAIQASPATYATGGLTLNFATMSGIDGGFNLPVSPTDLASPMEVYFESVSGSGWTYLWQKSTNSLKIMASSGGAAGTTASLEEMTNATAIPATVSGDTIQFKATFLRERS